MRRIHFRFSNACAHHAHFGRRRAQGKIISAPCRALASREEEEGVTHNERKLDALDSRLLSLRQLYLDFAPSCLIVSIVGIEMEPGSMTSRFENHFGGEVRLLLHRPDRLAIWPAGQVVTEHRHRLICVSAFSCVCVCK